MLVVYDVDHVELLWGCNVSLTAFDLSITGRNQSYVTARTQPYQDIDDEAAIVARVPLCFYLPARVKTSSI